MKLRVLIALLFLGSLSTVASAASPSQCAELLALIRQTKKNAEQAEGDSSQQAFILQALQQYIALYQAECQ